MLRSLEIRNYRNLRHLTIEKLGRVNLLVGKNNTGKTSVLEAVAIYVSSYSEGITIKSLLQQRGEYYTYNTRELSSSEKPLSISRDNLNSLSALYTDYTPSFFLQDSNDLDIHVGEVDKYKDFSNSSLTICLRKAYQTIRKDEFGREIIEYTVADKEEDVGSQEYRYEINFWRNHLYQTRYSLNSDRLFHEPSLNRANGESDQFQYVDSKNKTQQPIEHLFSKIALSDKEDTVVNALKIIEPKTERFSLIEDGRPIIKLSNGKIRNLSSMGDGVSRVFSIILSMVNCENGYLLIDEFENGLHYSVQEKLWEIIFYLAERLNIQVFATTHSSDTIRSFTSILAKQEKSDEAGKAIRLQLYNNMVRAVDYSPEELETAVEYNIEVR